MARTKLRGGQRIPFTQAEETARDAEEAKFLADRQTRKDAEAQKATDKTNGKQKLLDLGLTQAEVDALT
jgi:hypothetical protein